MYKEKFLRRHTKWSTVIPFHWVIEKNISVHRFGDIIFYQLYSCQKSFLVPFPQNDRLSELFDESDKYEDMVITDHLDTYNNLTLKTLAAFDWMLTQCPQAEYLLKTDDDMFIQVKHKKANVGQSHFL